MWFRYTAKARDVIALARGEASRHGDGEVSPEHLLLALLESEETTVADILDRVGVPRDRVRSEVYGQMGPPSGVTTKPHRLSPEGRRVFDHVYDEIRLLGLSHIGTEHLLLALIHDDGLAGQVLAEFGVELEAMRQAAREVKRD